jgi:DNA-binding NtrC family response regulator
MDDILFAWIGATDLRALKEPEKVGIGPIAQAVKIKSWKRIVLLCNYPDEQGKQYTNWLKETFRVKDVGLNHVSLSTPTDYGDIYRSTVDIIKKEEGKVPEKFRFTFHLSPGTPAMAAVWVILSKTRFPASLIESSRDHGVKTVSIPFDIAADYIPPQLHTSDTKIVQLTAAFSDDAQAFSDIVHRSEVIQRVIIKARLAAVRSVPVLIEGESGTGKELLAKAIHAASPRARKPFVAINCGAIPAELIETELFGHEKGAFTGASVKRQGYFEQADTGTLFLDEIGELPTNMQSKLLRVLQEGEVKLVGSTKTKKIDVRIIAATNKNLIQETAAGRFRGDLFYRLAVAVLHLPPLRDREGDIGMLIDTFMERINRECQVDGAEQNKIISASARNILQRHPWPGNIREMLNTLTRAYIWSSQKTIGETDIQEAILPTLPDSSGFESILGKPVSQGVDLPAIMQTVAAHYLEQALRETRGNKAKATRLLCLSNYQTLTNWMKKYGID